jgi:hypothetical protein
MEFWMLKDSSSFRQDFRTSWILWGALGSSWKRKKLRGMGKKTMGRVINHLEFSYPDERSTA